MRPGPRGPGNVDYVDMGYANLTASMRPGPHGPGNAVGGGVNGVEWGLLQ